MTFAFSGSSAKRLKEQLSLGNRYLNELNYEEAIAAFSAAIEIDPKSEQAYVGLVKAYGGMNDYESAYDVVQQGLTAVENSTELRKFENSLSDLLGYKDDGDKETDISESLFGNTYDDEDTKNKKNSIIEAGSENGEIRNSYAPKKEIINAEFWEGMVQLDDFIFRLDSSMTLGEVRDMLLQSNDGNTYTFGENNSFNFSEFEVAEIKGGILIYLDKLDVYKNGQKYASIGFAVPGELSEDITPKGEFTTPEDTWIHHIDNFSGHLYYAKGITKDGNGLDKESIREYFPGIQDSPDPQYGVNDRAYIIYDKDNVIHVHVVMSYEWPDEYKSHVIQYIRFRYNSETGIVKDADFSCGVISGERAQTALKAEGAN
ncbi:MAG: tetratricopeptide repeat protein [Lachnospiraceae bacterium]|nr:tetratricopeptide repeat protein [Lachnospiraceae bacterium]